MEMDEKVIFSSPGPFNCEQLFPSHPPHLLWFKIIGLTFQMCAEQGPNTRGVKGTSTTDNPMGKMDTFHQSTDPTLCATQQSFCPWEEDKTSAMCVLQKNKETRTKF
jgi:hypothetical protein